MVTILKGSAVYNDRGRSRSALPCLLVALLLLVAPATAHGADPSDAVRNHIGAGECAQALQVASSWLDANPDEPGAWRLVGDAHRCAGSYRDAVLAYRETLDRKPEDRAVLGLVQSLIQRLCTLQLDLVGADSEASPEITAATATGAPLTPWKVEPDTLLFRDLDPAASVQVTWRGAGYVPGQITLPPSEVGEERRVDLELDFVGTGALTLQTWEAAVVVTLVDQAGRTPAAEGGTIERTAGEVTVEVASELGTIRETVNVAPGGTTVLDVQELVPGRVTLLGVPEGSTVTRLAAPGAADEEIRSVPAGTGELEPSLGLRLSAVPFDGLRTGPCTFRIDNPLLGSRELEVFSIGGQLSGQPIDWASMEGTPALQERWATWQRESRGGKRKQAGPWNPLGQEADQEDAVGPAAALTAEPPTARRPAPRGLLAVIGGGTAAAGAVVFGISAGQGATLLGEMATVGDYAANLPAYEAARQGEAVGAVVLAAGTGALVGGLIQLAVQKAHDKRQAARTAPNDPEDP
jgi:hypothetical protein